MFGVPIQPYLLPPINQGDRIETWPKKACNNKQKTVQRLRSWWLGGRLGQGAAALSVVNTDNHILDLLPPTKDSSGKWRFSCGFLRKCNKPGLNPNSYKSPFLVTYWSTAKWFLDFLFRSGKWDDEELLYHPRKSRGKTPIFLLTILDFDTMNMQMT